MLEVTTRTSVMAKALWLTLINRSIKVTGRKTSVKAKASLPGKTGQSTKASSKAICSTAKVKWPGQIRTLLTKANGNLENSRAKEFLNMRMAHNTTAHGLIIRDMVKAPCVGKPKKEHMCMWDYGNKIWSTEKENTLGLALLISTTTAFGKKTSVTVWVRPLTKTVESTSETLKII